ncbi:hypothetical protein MHYP_G00302860 [Metynnis hypsauchen]
MQAVCLCGSQTVNLNLIDSDWVFPSSPKQLRDSLSQIECLDTSHSSTEQSRASPSVHTSVEMSVSPGMRGECEKSFLFLFLTLVSYLPRKRRAEAEGARSRPSPGGVEEQT